MPEHDPMNRPDAPAAEPSGSWIQKTPGVCGGRARVRNTRISVWGLVNRRQLGLSDAEVLRHIQGVTPADLQVAWDYYEKHREEIDHDIRQNEEA